MRSFYSVATARYESISPKASLISNAVRWLIQRQNDEGRWGGPDTLDEFISTTHVLMALFAVGVSPDASLARRAVNYLANIDKEKHLAFYWRAGVFLNLPEYKQIVKEDAEYIWANIGRVAVHRDYPLFFFLLKLTRFGELEGTLSFSINDVLNRIIAERTPGTGWYGRTSITTMALALIFDLKFEGRDRVVEEASRFVLSQFRRTGPEGRFHDNIVDDAFLLFNISERAFLSTTLGAPLMKPAEAVAQRLIGAAIGGTHWVSEPPFGGSVGPELYPTAVMIRALLAYCSKDDLLAQVSACLIDADLGVSPRQSARPVHPIWGVAPKDAEDDLCFVLMPFSPKKLTEIFERYVRRPVEREFRMRCIRADDIHRPTAIMRDVWEQLNRASVVIAELTHRNPNVFYELGMAHVLGKEVVLIAQTLDDVPFDLSGIRVILYEDSPSGYEELTEKLLKSIRAIPSVVPRILPQAT